MPAARSSALTFVLVVLTALSAAGADFVVDSLEFGGPDADPGDGVCATSEGICSLIAAVYEANALPGPDSVTFATGGSYAGFTGETISDDLEIRGVPGAILAGGVFLRGARLSVRDIGAWNGFISATDAELVITDVSFATSGGDISLTDSSATLTRFIPGYGNGGTFLTAENSDLLLSEVLLYNCTPDYFATSALTVEGGSLTLLDSEVLGCSWEASGRSRYGGGISATDARVRIERSSFTGLGYGGGLWVSGSPEIIVRDSQFVDNAAAGLVLRADRIEITGTRIEKNESYWYGQSESHPAGGGGAWLTAPVVVVRDCIVLDNLKVANGPSEPVGAGLFVDSADALIEDTRISGNLALASNHVGFRMREEGHAEGGGLLLIGSARVERCRVEGNAATHGAGIHSSGSLLLIDSAVTGNGPWESTDLLNDGAGLFLASGSASLLNTTIADNEADEGAELLVADGMLRLRHATISHGEAPDAAPVVVRPGASVSARDSVLAGGWPQVCDGTLTSEGGLFVEFPSSCDLVSAPGGVILDTDPLLGPLRARGISPARSPLPGSPLIDAASACWDLADRELTHDQHRQARPADGDGDGTSTCDLGAIEACLDPVDSDGDGIGDRCDLCPDLADALQEDSDDDGIGDACDVEEPSALDLDPSAPALLVSSTVTVTWEQTDEADWDLARGSLLDLAALGLSGSLQALTSVTAPEHQITEAGSFWFLVAGRRGALRSSFGRDSFGVERVLP